MSYTFDEICESQEFNHDQEFIEIERFNHLKQKLAKAVDGLKFYAEEFEIGRVYGFTVIRKAYSYDNFIKINECARQILKELGE